MKRAAAKSQLNLNAVVEGYTVGTPMFRMVNYIHQPVFWRRVAKGMSL